MPGASNTVEDCTTDRTPHTTCVSDDEELRRHQEDIVDAEGELQRLKDKLEQSAENLRQATETCMKCLADLNVVQKQQNQRSKLYSDIRERKIRRESLASGDVQQHRVNLVEQMRNNTKELVSAEHQEREYVKRYQELNVKIGLLLKKINQVESLNADKISQRDTAKADLDDITAEWQREHIRHEELKSIFSTKYFR